MEWVLTQDAAAEVLLLNKHLNALLYYYYLRFIFTLHVNKEYNHRVQCLYFCPGSDGCPELEDPHPGFHCICILDSAMRSQLSAWHLSSISVLSSGEHGGGARIICLRGSMEMVVCITQFCRKARDR